MCPRGVPERPIDFEREYLKIERVLVKYYRAKSLDGSPGKLLIIKTKIRPFDLGATNYIYIYVAFKLDLFIHIWLDIQKKLSEFIKLNERRALQHPPGTYSKKSEKDV